MNVLSVLQIFHKKICVPCTSFLLKLGCTESVAYIVAGTLFTTVNQTHVSLQHSSDMMSSASAPAMSSPRRKGKTVPCSVLLLDDTVDVFHVPVSQVTHLCCMCFFMLRKLLGFAYCVIHHVCYQLFACGECESANCAVTSVTDCVEKSGIRQWNEGWT